MVNDYILGITLAVCFSGLGLLIRKILKQRSSDQFFPAFIVLQSAKFIIMAVALFIALRFISGNSPVTLSSFLAMFTFCKFLEVYKIYKESSRVI